MESVYLETMFITLANADHLHARATHGRIVMWEDPVVAEVHRSREKMAADYNFDIASFFADLRKRQASLGDRLVTQNRRTNRCSRLSGAYRFFQSHRYLGRRRCKAVSATEGLRMAGGLQLKLYPPGWDVVAWPDFRHRDSISAVVPGGVVAGRPRLAG